jgi:hypothetical protein
MVYGTYNELVTGAYKPTYNWGASPCIYIYTTIYILQVNCKKISIPGNPWISGFSPTFSDTPVSIVVQP